MYLVFSVFFYVVECILVEAENPKKSTEMECLLNLRKYSKKSIQRYLRQRNVVSNRPVQEVYWDHPDRQANPLSSLPDSAFLVSRQNHNEGFLENDTTFSRIGARGPIYNQIHRENDTRDNFEDTMKTFDQSKYEINTDILANQGNGNSTWTGQPRKLTNLKETVVKIDVSRGGVTSRNPNTNSEKPSITNIEKLSEI